MSQNPEDPKTIRDIMSPSIVTITRMDTVGHAMQMLLKNKHTGMPVVDEFGKAIGVCTSLDIILAIGMGKLNHRLGELPLAIKVEKPVRTVSVDMPIKEALKRIVKRHIGRVIVVDKENRPVGVVGRKDLMAYYAMEAGISIEN